MYGGGGNTVTMVANAQVDLGNTYGDADTVDASNETSGIYLSADTQADVNGSEDRVYLLGSDATVSENGSYNFIEDVDPDATADIVIDESNSFIDLPSSDTVTINGSNDYITGDNDNIQTNGNSDPVVGDYDITTGSGSDDITDGTGDTDYGSEYQNNNFSDGDYVGNDYGDFSFGYDSDLGLVATSGNSITNVVAQNDAANGYQLQAASANAALASAMDAQAGDFATSPSTLNKQPAHAFWTQSTITWSFASGATSGASPISSAIGALEQPIIESAIQAWASASGLTLQQVSGNADLNIGWADFETPTSNVAGFTSASSLGNMLLPGSVVRLEDPGETALVADLSGEITYAGTDVTLYQVALHEIGHALGLADDSDPDSVMYASLGPTNMTLDNTDIAAIQSLYGPEGTATAFFPATLSAAAAAASLATGSAPVLAAGLVH